VSEVIKFLTSPGKVWCDGRGLVQDVNSARVGFAEGVAWIAKTRPR
jgi:hypothetical protein